MRKTLMLISILLVSFVFAQAQDKPQAYKFGEFGDLQESEWKQKLDTFSKMLISLPDAKLHIIVYAESGKSLTSIEDSISQYRNYLYKTKNIEWDKFNFERGGFRNSQVTELWIVPKDANDPVSTPAEEFKAEKFAEFGKANDEFVQEKMDEFYLKLQQTQVSHGYIIIYGNVEDTKQRELQIRNSMRFRCFDAARITIVVADGSSLKTILWIIPEGADEPTP